MRLRVTLDFENDSELTERDKIDSLRDMLDDLNNMYIYLGVRKIEQADPKGWVPDEGDEC